MASTSTPTRVGFVGLGAMGLGMATNLNKNPAYTVVGYDIWQPSADKFREQHGSVADSPRAVAAESDFLICMVASSQQADGVLFDEATGAVPALPQNAVVLICSTVAASYHERLPARLAQAGRPDVLVLDTPVSGGTVRAAAGTLTIFASGPPAALSKADQLLAAMSEKLYVVPGPASSASKIKTVNQLLVGTHIAAAAEAMGLAAKMGLNTKQVYDIITNAAGNSWAFENRVPHMLQGDWTPLSALDIFVKDMGIVVATGRELQFPLPLASTAEQLYTMGRAQGMGRDDDAGVVRVFLPGTPNAVQESATPITQETTPVRTPLEISKVGFVGLGAMGSGMASSIVRAGFSVHGFDVYPPSIEKFVESNAGKETAVAAPTPAQAAKEAQVFVVMVQNAAQADDVLFGAGQAADALPNDAVVILCSTVPPAYIRDLESRLANLGRGITLVDAPVSGGVVRAAKGDLTIICSGQPSTLAQVNGILLAMSGVTKNLCHVSGGVGAASSVKLINQLLAGVHIAAAAEAMAFAARLGLDTRATFDMLCKAAAWSWMMENRAPQMLNADWTPHSALAIFVKDLGIVLDEARRLSYYSPISAAAHNLYLACAAHGWVKESDAGVVRFWELMTNVSVHDSAGKIMDKEVPSSTSAVEQAEKPQPLPAQATLDSLPKEYSEDVLDSIRSQVTASDDALPVLVVLDDDPTGTQTCHDINVLTVWDSETLKAEFETNSPGFFILTNSRALPGPEAKQLILEICKQVKQAADNLGKKFEIVLRGDSTLRGHLPEEPEAAEEALGKFDGWVLAPFFFQGGRMTINDVHYVKEADTLVPAHQTPFAQDATFGYKNSNLRRYIQEKCGSRFANDEDSFLSVSIEDIRVGGPDAVAEKLLAATSHKVIIVNAAAESDMHVFVAGLLKAERSGRRYIFRTGAAFVSSRLGIRGKAPMSLNWNAPEAAASSAGGLILAGSYVPKTTAQLAALRQRRGDKLYVVELEVSQLIASQESSDALIDKTIAEASAVLEKGKDVLVMTSRGLITGGDALSSLQIGSKVAAALVRFLRNLETRPRYVIAKGGITSSDAATKGLLMKRARVVGQAAPGVPLWVCHEETSRHVGVPYVVFPGNVGGDGTLADVVEASSL